MSSCGSEDHGAATVSEHRPLAPPCAGQASPAGEGVMESLGDGRWGLMETWPQPVSEPKGMGREANAASSTKL